MGNGTQKLIISFSIFFQTMLFVMKHEIDIITVPRCMTGKWYAHECFKDFSTE